MRHLTSVPTLFTPQKASTGRITPVSTMPRAPQPHWVPSAKPICGGKIRLPAPNMVENSARPTMMLSLVMWFFFI